MAAPSNRYAVTVAGVVALTGIAAVTAALADGTAAATVVTLVSTNILALMGAAKIGSTHAEVKSLTNGGLAQAIKDASASTDSTDTEGEGA